MADPDEPTAETAEVLEQNFDHMVTGIDFAMGSDEAVIAVTDAQRFAPGQRVTLHRWDGDTYETVTVASVSGATLRVQIEPYQCADPKLSPGENGLVRVWWRPIPGWSALVHVHPTTMEVPYFPTVRRQDNTAQSRSDAVVGRERRLRAMRLADVTPLDHLPLTRAVLRARIERLQGERFALREAELRGGGLP